MNIQLKNEILNCYYEKSRIIQIIKKAFINKNLDPTYNTEFETDNPELTKILTPEIKNNISKYFSIIKTEQSTNIMFLKKSLISGRKK